MPGNKKQFRLFGVIVNTDAEKYALDDVTPSQFQAFLRSCAPDDEIEIMINSPGGSVTAGLAIANMIKAASQKITARVYGLAASMASVIAAAAPDLAMFRSSFLMIHNPWVLMMGDANDLRKEADVMDSMKSACIAIYASKFGTVTAEELAKMMDDETWMLGSEASAFGLQAMIEDDPAQMAACIHGPAMFAKIPDAAKKYYSGDPEMKHLQPSAAQSATSATPPAAAPKEDPAVVALSKRAEEQTLRAQQAEAKIDELNATVAALTGERDAAKAAATKAEEQRRDHQSKADKLAKELEQARAEHKAAADRSTQQISALNAEKGALEKRLAAVTLNALGAPHHDCAQSWDDAIAECGSYEAAKAKYPHLAEAYRLAHTPKGEQSAAD